MQAGVLTSGAGRRLLASAAVTLTLVPAVVLAQLGPDILTFHGDRQRTGWNAEETVLTPENVATSFGPIWSSPQLDNVTLGGKRYAPHLYAVPLYKDAVTLTVPPYAGYTASVIFAATSNAWVYAINARPSGGTTPISAGTILWAKQLGTPALIPKLDGGLPLGILSTPVIDAAASPATLYAASVDETAGWQVWAIDIANGNILPGWPIPISDSTLAPVNQNGPTRFQDVSSMSQRGALNLSPDGKTLYVPFGAYGDGGAGWMVAISTASHDIASAYAGAPSAVAFANGTMWGSAGPAIDGAGNVYATTGNSPDGSTTRPHTWGESLLAWRPSAPLSLSGTYTPWNYCQLDTADIDLGSGQPVVIDLDPATTSTPHLLAFGGKQGNVYLVDRDHLPGRVDQRPPCSTDSSNDASLLPPGPQPQFGKLGPLNVFGPYTDAVGNLDYAKGRSQPAWFKAPTGTSYLFASGTSKANANTTSSSPPGVARLRIVTTPSNPAYLAIDQLETTQTLLTPGSPVLTSDSAGNNAIVWLLVANITRDQSLLDPSANHPILYAFDAGNLNILYQSTPALLAVGGKYSAATVTHGIAIVGSDRITAFGIVPTIKIVNPAAGAAFMPGSNITIAAAAADPSGTITKIEFNEGSNLVGTATSAPYSIVWTNISAGNYTLTAVATSAAGHTVTSAAVPIAVAAAHVLGINAGGPAVGNWVADTDYSGGRNSMGTIHSINTSGVSNPAPASVYQSGRIGDSVYTIPNLTPHRNYTVRLHFTEYIYTASSRRRFNVGINNITVLPNFDVFAAAGTQFKAIVRSFTATADARGQIVIAFTSVVDTATVQGIEIL